MDIQKKPSFMDIQEQFGVRRVASDPDLLSQLDGFDVIQEGISIEVKEENIAPYTLPQEALTFEPRPDDIICRFPNGDTERKIHCNTELTDLEIEQLAQLRTQARSQKCKFFPSIIAMASRYLSTARGSCTKALDMMEKTQQWRKSFFTKPLYDADVFEDMKHGVVYFSGRDRALRPVIVVRVSRLPAEWYSSKIEAFMRILIFTMEYFIRYMIIPGKIENLNIIVDLKGLGVTQVPIGPLKEVYSVMSKHYVGRVFKFYIANMPFALRPITGIVKKMLTDRQQQKLVFLDNLEPLKSMFSPTQLEDDLGGSRPAIKSFFPFPLEPGPFDAGSKMVNRKSIPGVHRVLSPHGVIGRLWDPRRSTEDNTMVEFSREAVSIFKACGAPLPSRLDADEIREDGRNLRQSVGTNTFNTIRRGSLMSIAKLSDGNDVLATRASVVHTLNLILPTGDKDPARRVTRPPTRALHDLTEGNRRHTAAGDGTSSTASWNQETFKFQFGDEQLTVHPDQFTGEAEIVEDRQSTNTSWICSLTACWRVDGRCNYR